MNEAASCVIGGSHWQVRLRKVDIELNEEVTKVDVDRIVRDTLELVRMESVTGDTRGIAERYKEMLLEAGCTVDRYEWIPNNPTLVATFGEDNGGPTILFNGHLDAVPLAHGPAVLRDGRIYGRGACDMKGSLACVLEVIRTLRQPQASFRGKIIVVANSLHESPGGRGEDLIALTKNISLSADAAIVMEGATRDCTIAQLGSATFRVAIKREGEPAHQLYAPPGASHPIEVAAEAVRLLRERNAELENEWIEDIGFASYFVGSVHSGQFYNQLPNQAELEGVRRYRPDQDFAEAEAELRSLLSQLTLRYGVEIDLDMRKVRDGYRIDSDHPAIAALQRAVRRVRGIELPLAGKKVVTDAGILVKALNAPVLCHGPDQSTAHGDVEYVEIRELELATQVYLQFIQELAEQAG
ncbi:M20 family metallopeptidase [Paenibacillus sp. MBLB4367]|uniref:M20 family metallopeptidase n=1 Tax=Paenibacillus sp. MBLB4367 TaxID=3384767 RepID=UPI0039082570